jgi:hypothetical protein
LGARCSWVCRRLPGGGTARFECHCYYLAPGNVLSGALSLEGASRALGKTYSTYVMHQMAVYVLRPVSSFKCPALGTVLARGRRSVDAPTRGLLGTYFYLLMCVGMDLGGRRYVGSGPRRGSELICMGSPICTWGLSRCMSNSAELTNRVID